MSKRIYLLLLIAACGGALISAAVFFVFQHKQPLDIHFSLAFTDQSGQPDMKVFPGEHRGMEIKVTNNGKDTAENVQIESEILPGEIPIATTVNQQGGTCIVLNNTEGLPKKARCGPKTLKPDQSYSMYIALRIDERGLYCKEYTGLWKHTVKVSADNAESTSGAFVWHEQCPE